MNNSPAQQKKRKSIKSSIILMLHILVFFLFLILYYQFQIMQTYSYEKLSGPILNPLMGLSPWATIEKSEQPHRLVFVDTTWREIEPQEGVFDFESFEIEQQLERWREEGIRVVFRFVIDKPAREPHINIPDWLYEKIAGDGDIYDVEYGKGFSPNYSNEVFISYHQKVMNALGERYGQDDFFAYVELGSLGHWGEWHIKYDSEIRLLPKEEIRDRYVIHYYAAFPNSKLLMRRPFSIAKELGLGIYNDMTGHPEATKNWLDWIINGGEYTQTGEKNALSPMPTAWQTAPIGGEQTGSMTHEEVYRENLEQTIMLLEESHTTFIGPGGPYELVQGGAITKWDRSRIGYYWI